MAGLLFVAFWAAIYAAAWWGALYLGKFLPETSPTAFNVIRVVLSIVFCLAIMVGRILWGFLIYLVDGVDPGPPIGAGYVIAAVIFGWRLGALRDPNFSRDSLASPKPLTLTGHDEDMRDPYKIAGEELLSSKVDPTAWAHALVEAAGDDAAIKSAYIRWRVRDLQQLAQEQEAERKQAIETLLNLARNEPIQMDDPAGFASSRRVTPDDALLMAAFGIYRDGDGFVVYTDGVQKFRSFANVVDAAMFANRSQPNLAEKGAPYRFNEAELLPYGREQLDHLRKFLRDNPESSLGKVRDAICNKVGWDCWNARSWGIRKFLEEYYASLRESIAISPR